MSKLGSIGAGAFAAAWVFGLLGCAGGKPAESAGTCPDGTVLHGSDCVPASAGAAKEKDPDEAMPAAAAAQGSGSTATPPAPETSTGGGDATPSAKTPYDKDAVEAQLKRGARSVKSSCGAATDDNGEANGPWGKTKASVTLGRNGHVKQVSVPSPYDGTPVGVCIVHAFDKIQFPPYASSSDATVDWDVEVVKPKK